jgi:lysozyme
MRLTEQGLDFLAAWEGGCQTRVYLDVAGYPTIGVGHLIIDGEDFVEGVEYDHDHLMGLFREDVRVYEAAASRHITASLERHQFDALVSFTFNLGESNFRRSTLLKRVNASDFDDVPAQLLRWNKAGGREVRGLTRRREAEGAVFALAEYRNP